MASKAELDNWFTYHPPVDDQADTFDILRKNARQLADVFNNLCPDCPDKTAAMRSLRISLMSMNLAIACNPRSTHDSSQDEV
jgi:hypothetical protein